MSKLPRLASPPLLNPSLVLGPSQSQQPALVQSSHPSQIPLPQLQAQLNQVCNDRGKDYHQIHAIIFGWTKDNTGASLDMDRLELAMKIAMNVKANKFQIPADKSWPTEQLFNALGVVFRESIKTPHLRHLLVLAYIGHGYSDAAKGLTFESSKKKYILWSWIKSTLENSTPNLDICVVLDCCYSGMARREQMQQTISVLAACGEKETARARCSSPNRIPKRTFTQRLSQEIIRGQRFNKGKLALTTLYSQLKEATLKTEPQPRLICLGGTHPIVLPLVEMNTAGMVIPSSPLTATAGQKTNVIAKLIIDGNDRETAEGFKDMFASLPRKYQVEVVNAYQNTHSILLFITMSWEAWGLLSMILDLKPVAEVIGPPLLRPILMPYPVLRELPVEPVGENMPPKQEKGSKRT
ncbi:hypothetical protein N7495_005312 [Penicillium taxi]|uniref:uncharacterized protein n=1 Tax=Penicillium taxi TaxID=168475 RepID=UPI002545197A|nr:uncharacterized protein N7495_005312 [Penicillium taxi]KAJ5893621.1 hypothetical protein N7495_005312 [Penicillium taxi]